VISVEDFMWYVDDALHGMIEIVTALGDDLANRRPDVPGSNSPFALLTHCLGVMEFWGGDMIAGRPVTRDRAAEFRATGRVADLVALARESRRRFAADLERFEPYAPPRGTPSEEDADHPVSRTQGAVLVHVYEELAQHRGQMEGARDVILAPWARLV
jgi:uncharacterized damage-inducible protein DinB